MALISSLLGIYEIILIARVFMSWVQPDPYHPIVRWVYMLTEPILEPIRRLLPSSGIDFSPLIVFLLIGVIRRMLGIGFLF